MINTRIWVDQGMGLHVSVATAYLPTTTNNKRVQPGPSSLFSVELRGTRPSKQREPNFTLNPFFFHAGTALRQFTVPSKFFLLPVHHIIIGTSIHTNDLPPPSPCLLNV